MMHGADGHRLAQLRDLATARAVPSARCSWSRRAGAGRSGQTSASTSRDRCATSRPLSARRGCCAAAGRTVAVTATGNEAGLRLAPASRHGGWRCRWDLHRFDAAAVARPRHTQRLSAISRRLVARTTSVPIEPLKPEPLPPPALRQVFRQVRIGGGTSSATPVGPASCVFGMRARWGEVRVHAAILGSGLVPLAGAATMDVYCAGHRARRRVGQWHVDAPGAVFRIASSSLSNSGSAPPPNPPAGAAGRYQRKMRERTRNW